MGALSPHTIFSPKIFVLSTKRSVLSTSDCRFDRLPFLRPSLRSRFELFELLNFGTFELRSNELRRGCIATRMPRMVGRDVDVLSGEGGPGLGSWSDRSERSWATEYVVVVVVVVVVVAP